MSNQQEFEIENLYVVAEVNCFGVKFNAYRNQDGHIVYSRRGAAKALSLPISTFSGCRSQIAKAKSVREARVIKYLRDTSTPLINTLIQETQEETRVQTVSNGVINEVIAISKAEVVAWLLALADYGIPKFAAMRDAGLATVLTMAEDEAFGIQRSREEYLSDAEALQKIIEEHRLKLKQITQQLTKPKLGPNVFKKNNELIYFGQTRDTYEGLDAGIRHLLSQSAEMMEVGARLAGASLGTAIDVTHNYLKEQFPETLS